MAKKEFHFGLITPDNPSVHVCCVQISSRLPSNCYSIKLSFVLEIGISFQLQVSMLRNVDTYKGMNSYARHWTYTRCLSMTVGYSFQENVQPVGFKSAFIWEYVQIMLSNMLFRAYNMYYVLYYQYALLRSVVFFVSKVKLTIWCTVWGLYLQHSCQCTYGTCIC